MAGHLGFFGVELHADEVVAADGRGEGIFAVGAGGKNIAWIGGGAVVGMHVIHLLAT